MNTHNAVPIPDYSLARSFLSFLIGTENKEGLPQYAEAEQDILARWLTECALGAFACRRSWDVYPELAERLQTELFNTAAQNSLHWRSLGQMDEKFAAAGISAVLLKGAALAETVYDSFDQRSMTDVDLWLQEQAMAQACSIMAGLGFDAVESVNRPLALQLLSGGEIQFYSRDKASNLGVSNLIELHLSPFEGWWIKRTAVIDTGALWGRKVPLEGWNSFYQLAAEDTIIQIALHLAVGHQFGAQTIRSLIDIALLAQSSLIDWGVVADRAEEWRVATAVWLVLYHVQQLTGAQGLEAVLSRLQPSSWRRRRLLRIVSPDSILAGEEHLGQRERYLFLLLLVDRPQDAGRLASRTLWPEEEWLAARYGGEVGHWQHIRRLIMEGDV